MPNTPTAQKHVLVIHGPNLNMLGNREPEVYGRTTLKDINNELLKLGQDLGLTVETFQSNLEGAIVDKIQSALSVNGIIINPAAFTHTSVSIRDALLMVSVPVIEVHLSNVYKREAFRHHSYVVDVVTGQIMGLGADGYYLALRALAGMLLEKDSI
jgi:3-dehydroquinate dehydratase-2